MSEEVTGVASTERVERTPPSPTAVEHPAEGTAEASGRGAARRLPTVVEPLRRGWARLPRHWVYIGSLFLAAKLVLTLTGLVTLSAYAPFLEGLAPNEELDYGTAQRAAVSPHRWLSMWFHWDSFIYAFLGSAPLDENWREFAFPLLYPFLGRGLAPLLGGNTAMALLLVSNIAFVAVLYYAYRLGEQLLGDETAARRFTRYVVLLPTAFLFQAALTESLFLALVLATFYYAERERWLLVGIVGYFMALSRSVGFLVVVPLALILLRKGGYRLHPGRWWGYLRTGWPLFLVPLGWLSFMAFCKLQGGDWFAYSHAQQKGWSIRTQSPLVTAWDGLTIGGATHATRVWFAVAVLGIVAVAALRKLDPAYVAYALLMVLVPLSMGPPVYGSLLRYLAVVFPVALVLAQWARRPAVDTLLTSTLPLVQGALFVTWLSYWTHYII